MEMKVKNDRLPLKCLTKGSFSVIFETGKSDEKRLILLHRIETKGNKRYDDARS
jgi:hypothetical protein